MPNGEIRSEIPAPVHYPPTPPRKKSKVLWIVIGVIVLAVIGVSVSLASRVWDPLWNPFRPEPAEVIEEMSAKMKDLKSLHSRAKIDVTGKENTEEVFKLFMDFASDSDNSDPQNPKSAGEFYINFDMEGMGLSFGGEAKTISKDFYLKLTIIPPIPGFPIDVSQFEEQWIKIDEESVKNLLESLGVPITSEMEQELEKAKQRQKEMLQKLQALLKNKKLYIVKREFPDKEIGGLKTYYYLVALNKEEIKKLIPGIFEILYETFPPSNSGFPMTPLVPGKEEILTEILEAFDEFFEKVGEITARVWIGKKDYLLYKIKGEKEIDLAKFKEGTKGKITVGTEIDFSNFNQPLKIEAPEEFKTLTEIFRLPSAFPPWPE